MAWGGDVLRKCEAGLYSSDMPSPVVDAFADVDTVVRGVHWVVASMGTWFPLVVTAPSGETGGVKTSALVDSCFLVVGCSVAGSAIGDTVLDQGLGVGTGV